MERSMSREILTGRTADGREKRYLLEVFAEGDHWASTLSQLNEKGLPLDTTVAPRFYGLTADAARRKMLSVLENQYDEVEARAEA
jgi:hypothetical protein